jgi:hypothetical protein
MAERMEMEENLFSEGMRDKRADCRSGNVNQKGLMRRKGKRGDVKGREEEFCKEWRELSVCCALAIAV